MNYIIFERTQTETKEVARIVNGRFTGEKAQDIKELLKEEGYPKKSPMRILHGSMIWAEELKSDG